MNSPLISIFVATDEKGGIGKNGQIPWHIKEDLVRLSNMTRGHAAIIGQKTYESMAGYYDRSGKPMPAKEYIVVTEDKNFKSLRNNTFAATSIAKAMKRAKKSGTEIFIIGGASIYKQTIDLVDRLYLTLVKGEYDCDTFFPDYSKFKNKTFSQKNKNDKYEFEFLILER
jgi:dihydrofolate reductase